jgi:hypothetical protein
MPPAHPAQNPARRLGLPDVLPPVRLRDPAELAAETRTSPLLGRVAELARWCGAGRKVSGVGPVEWLRERPAGGEVPVEYDRIRLWRVAVSTGFINVDDDLAMCTDRGERWPDLPAAEGLYVWAEALEELLDNKLLSELGDIAFTTAGQLIALLLFLSRRDGMPRDDLLDRLREAVRADIVPERWTAWTERHGDPGGLLLASLIELGAAEPIDPAEIEAAGAATSMLPFETLTGPLLGLPDMVRLTPLGTWALYEDFVAAGLDIPRLPPPAELTTEAFVEFARTARPVELADERAVWLATREPVAAARELLAHAAGIDAIGRVRAVTLASTILKDRAGTDTAAEVWTAALEPLSTRGYAKIELAALRGVPGTEDLRPDERSWMLADLILAHTAFLPEAFVPGRLRDLLSATPGRIRDLLEPLGETGHPGAGDALRLVARFFPDRRIAAAARKVLSRRSL